MTFYFNESKVYTVLIFYDNENIKRLIVDRCAETIIFAENIHI